MMRNIEQNTRPFPQCPCAGSISWIRSEKGKDANYDSMNHDRPQALPNKKMNEGLESNVTEILCRITNSVIRTVVRHTIQPCGR